MSNTRKFLSFIVVLFFLFQASLVSAAEPIDEARELISEYYVEEIPDWVLSKPTIQEMVQYLDTYSTYMSAEEMTEFVNAIDQQLVGIGVVLEEDPLGVKIISVIQGGPADKAGIQAGDIITKVGETSLAGESIQTAISLISGNEDTQVTLTYLQLESGSQITTTLKREIIKLPNVEYAMLGGNIGYVRLNSFAQDSAADITLAIQKLQGAKGWIFDLRNNGGGYVSVAQEVAGFFTNVTKAFQLRYRDNRPYVYSAMDQQVKFDSPTSILINNYSASASEMVAASVKEQGGATLYGQQSFGKGSMQALFTLSDASVLKLTTAKFFSPNGTPVHEIGVSPDYVTPEGEELGIAHRDQLMNSLKGYKKLPTLEQVPATKVFNVKMNMKMDWASAYPEHIQLIQLGGKEAAVDLSVHDEQNLVVTPKQKLQSGGKYLLIIHPKWTSYNAKQMKQGIYLEITVK